MYVPIFVRDRTREGRFPDGILALSGIAAIGYHLIGFVKDRCEAQLISFHLVSDNEMNNQSCMFF